MNLLRDLDPRHLSATPFLVLLSGFAVFFISGWFIVMELGGWWSWVGGALGLFLIVAGAWSAAEEKQDEEDSEEGA